MFNKTFWRVMSYVSIFGFVWIAMIISLILGGALDA
jgi:hypothetical protein